MLAHPRSHRMPHPLAPQRVRVAAAERRVARAVSATAFVARVLLVAIAVVLAVTLLALAPRTVSVPLGFVLLGGLLVGGLLGMGDALWTERRRGRSSG